LFQKRKRKKMSDNLVDRVAELRERLIKQSRDRIGMDDYLQQLRAYQEMILEIIDILAIIAERPYIVDVEK
jgi:hypothetical protein